MVLICNGFIRVFGIVHNSVSFNFDAEATIQAMRDGSYAWGKEGFLTPLLKQLTEAAMAAEIDEHMAAKTSPNRKNGTTPKTIKSPAGQFEHPRVFFSGTTYVNDLPI